MTMPQLLAAVITLSAAFSYINHRWIRLPTTIGLMVMAMVLSLVLIIVGIVHDPFSEMAEGWVASIGFYETLMHGMLGFLLFAGALHVDLGDLSRQKGVIALLATVGVIISTLLIALLFWLTTAMFGHPVKWIVCLLFGALISPTDPISVLGLLKRVGAPESLATKIAGESLFNDGIGVVVFMVVFSLAGLDGDGTHLTAGTMATLFVQEAVGGAVFGFVIGAIAYSMLKSIDHYQVEILISLALVTGGYTLATALHVSGPIAMVVAGLLMGNHGRTFAMSQTTRVHLDTFWELIDEILNALLFVLIGLELIVLSFSMPYVLTAVVMIPVVIFARFVAVGLPVTALRWVRGFTPHAVKALTWGGLRGGISVALALYLPKTINGTAFADREIILTVTYAVVVFSIVVQGLTISPMLRRWGLTSDSKNPESHATA